MHKSTYLIYGVKIARQTLKDWGFSDFWDDRLIPFVEGHPGAKFSILTGESDDVFAGIVLSHSSYDDYEKCDIIPIEFEPVKLNNDLHLAGLHTKLEQICLYFVDMWS